MSFLTRHRRPTIQTPEIVLRDAVDQFMNDALTQPSRFFTEPFALSTVPSWKGVAESVSSAVLPDIDLSETDKEIRVVADVPGYDPKNVTVEIKDNYLVMQGSKEEEKEEKRKRWYRKERHGGSFYREIALPVVDETKAKCGIKNGMLTVTIPKKAEAKGKSLPVEVQT